jgi:hypothetical protein
MWRRMGGECGVMLIMKAKGELGDGGGQMVEWGRQAIGANVLKENAGGSNRGWRAMWGPLA